MGLWAKSVVIINSIRAYGKQSIRNLADRTGLSKSSVHRHLQAMDRRDRYPESSFWETPAGRAWLIRLVVATLFVFGLKRGVGAETLSEFFSRLRLEGHVGCSPSALRTVMHTLERLLLETAAAWEKEGIAHGEIRPVIGAVDETFLQRMMLVFMDLATGYLLMEEVATDRSFDTWFDRTSDRPALLRYRCIECAIPEYFGGRDMGCLGDTFAFWSGLLRPSGTLLIRFEAHLLGQLLQGRHHLRGTHAAENAPLVLRDRNHHAVIRLGNVVGNVIEGEFLVNGLGAMHAA